MKTLLVIRHAKSSWEIGSMKDFDRPLNDRGNRDAPLMAENLFEKKIDIACFLSSPALRARTTAGYFAAAYGRSAEDIILVPKLYEASIHTFYEVVAGINATCHSAAIFSHNPGITEFVNSLGIQQVDDMPTCAIYAITIDTHDWTSFKTARKEFLFFKQPKQAF